MKLKVILLSGLFGLAFIAPAAADYYSDTLQSHQALAHEFRDVQRNDMPSGPRPAAELAERREATAPAEVPTTRPKARRHSH
ncbi:hypothetical protein ACETRX_12450 [Labrys portucalensis]|uniref:DUF4148 domain-containing protein n=1 Tax=Labrys neptuniae TaxID=376174 RepID=A0ABV6ZE80_9HYPH